jgi:putative oxidoreductase
MAEFLAEYEQNERLGTGRLTKLGGGLAIFSGYKVRLVSVLLARFCIVSGAVFHHNFSEQTQTIVFLKRLTMAGGFLAFFVSGEGISSLAGRP